MGHGERVFVSDRPSLAFAQMAIEEIDNVLEFLIEWGAGTFHGDLQPPFYDRAGGRSHPYMSNPRKSRLKAVLPRNSVDKDLGFGLFDGMAKETKIERQQRAQKIVKRLKRYYPDAKCALEYEADWQLLLATILSAQCTDERVNQVTRRLFQKYPTLADIAAASLEALEQEVRPTGFFRNKARSLKTCAQKICSEFAGEVPAKIEDLVGLPGVGRKTANVVLGNAFHIASGVVVDTHVGRLSRRLGLTSARDPVRVEEELCAILPKSQWVQFSHELIFHGRQVCKARKPACETCFLEDLCAKKMG